MPHMVIANTLKEGRVVFLTGDGSWVAAIADGEIRAEFRYPDRLDRIEHAHAFEDRQVHRQQRLTDVESWMVILLEEGDVPPVSLHQAPERRPGRPTADDEHVSLVGSHVVLTRLLFC